MMANLSTIAASLGNSSQISMPGTFGLDRLELAANFGRGIGLQVPHVEVRRTAGQEDVDDRLVRPRALAASSRSSVGQRQPAQGHAADRQEVAAGHAVAKAAIGFAAIDRQHGGGKGGRRKEGG